MSGEHNEELFTELLRIRINKSIKTEYGTTETRMWTLYCYSSICIYTGSCGYDVPGVLSLLAFL